MRYLFTGMQAKELDTHAIETVGFPGLVLMEKAAMTLVSVLMERERQDRGVLFVCGTGNNGGDGLAAARMLYQQGVPTAILMVGEAGKLSPDAKKQVELAAACDVPAVTEEAVFSPAFDVIVDGLFGVGLSREVTGVYEKVIQDINQSGKKVYAVDVPSGINGNDGTVMNAAVKADVTVTFGVNKLGLVLYPGCQYAGEVVVGDIGYPEASYRAVRNPAYYYEPEDLQRILPARRPDGHKGSFGHVSVIGGSREMGGAALFSAKAAYAAGAGLVHVCSAEENRNLLLSGVPEILFSSYGNETEGIDREALEQVLAFSDVVVLGPGLGKKPLSKEIVQYVLQYCEKPVILDGDGITLCKKEEISGKKNLILTPHPKEFSVISGKKIDLLKADLISLVCSFAEETGCIVAGKDARTVVGNGREVYVNVSGNSGMATGGSGDVLTGIIAAFLAQGVPAFEAVKAGVYVHGIAGDFFVQRYNEYSLTASGLIQSLNDVLRVKALHGEGND
ncbi:MAG: NAD(P)H-hydrate dehydratase [Roseburia sp.]|nr:NAD(P)H-hydrate dehydratase [Roseburia sp.]